MDDNQIYEQIEKYLKGALTESERLSFEAQLREDTKLAEEVEFYRNTMRAAEWKGTLEEVEAELKQEHFFEMATSEAARQKATSPQKSNRWWILAAVIAVSIVIVLLAYANLGHSNQAIALAHYEEPDLSATTKGTIPANDPLREGADAYYSGGFEQASQLFSSVPTTSDHYDRAQYSLAHTYFQQKQYDQAIAAFQTVIQITNKQWLKEEAEWYLLLTLLANDETGATFQALLEQLLEDENHRYHVFAKEVREEL